MSLVGSPDQWVLYHNPPSDGTKPLVTIPGVPGVRHTIRGIYSFAKYADPPYGWNILSTPAAATKASVTINGAGSKYHVITGFGASFVPGTAWVAGSGTVNIIDGNTGGTVMASFDIGSQMVASPFTPQQIIQTGLRIQCTIAGPATIEFAAAGGAASLQKVWMQGFSCTTQKQMLVINDGATTIANFALPYNGGPDPTFMANQLELTDLQITGSIGNPVSVTVQNNPQAGGYHYLTVFGESRGI